MNMFKTDCRRCLRIRALLLAFLCGGAAGWVSMHYGAGRDLSMFATFAGAILPLMWFARYGRDGGE